MGPTGSIKATERIGKMTSSRPGCWAEEGMGMAEKTPAGWHTDPFARYEHRYWDGTRWTDHVARGGAQSHDPVAIDGAAAEVQDVAPGSAIETSPQVSSASPPPIGSEPQFAPTAPHPNPTLPSATPPPAVKTTDDGRRRWKTWQLCTASIVALIVGLVAGAAAGGGDSAEKSKAGTASTSTTINSGGASSTSRGTTGTTAAPSGKGSRSNPLALGTTTTLGDWEVTVVSFQGDATAAVQAENQFNDPPTAGNVYSLARVRATYRGAGEGTAGFGLRVGLVGDDNRKYSDSDCGAVEPDGMTNQPTVLAGGTVEGNQCLQVPMGQLGSGVLYVEASLSFNDDPAWWRST